MGAPPSVDRIVTTALDCAVQSCEPATAGRMARTYVLTLDDEPGRAVCKLGGPSIRTGDVVEPLVVRLVDETSDLPAPSVLATGRLRTGTDSERCWALYEFREGETPTPFPDCPPPVRRRLLETVGSVLGRLHDTHQFERTGALARDGDTLRVTDHRGFHAPTAGRALLRRLPGGGRVDAQPVLTHGDLYPGNLLVDGDVTALLDWGNAHVTTAGYALARAELRFIDWFRFPARERERLRESLRQGYERHRPLPPDYPRATAPHKLLWLVQSAERHRRHVTTNRGRRQLGDHARSALASLRG
jgi:aminoglycoside phosphotransferase (APT) family kinase protein